MSSANKIVPLPLPPEQLSDADIVSAASLGNLRAQEHIYRTHVRYVYAVVLRLLCHQADTEDVVQDTFTQAFTELHRLRTPNRLRAWLTQIAVHKVHRIFRKRKMTFRLFSSNTTADMPLGAQLTSDASSETRAEIALLDQQLQQLDDTTRMCWMLRRIEEFTIDEVAAATGFSPATVKRKISAADCRVQYHTGDSHD